MRLLSWSVTDTGRKRDHNEDSYLVDAELRLFAVADGMGGHQGGEHASRLACEVLRRELAAAEGAYADRALRLTERRSPTNDQVTQRLPIIDDRPTEDSVSRRRGYPDDADPAHNPDTTDDDQDTGETTQPTLPASVPAATIVMAAAARHAGHEIYDTAQRDPNLRGMGTTLTAMLFDDGVMHLVHAGDSRAYLLRDGRLKQMTEDHSWIREQVKAGVMTEAEAKESKFRHIITRSVGFEPDVEVDTADVIVQAGDCFLLCSDGMSNYMENDELERVLNTTWFRRAPQLLVDIANDRGGDDNITVLVVYIANDVG